MSQRETDPTADLIARDRKRVWHPYAPPTTDPIYVVERAEGVHLHLADGRVLIDGMSSWWSAIHGYRDPHIEAAIQQQLKRLPHVMFGGLTHEPAVRLCERLVEIAPEGLERVFLCDSGSIAVEVAIKIAFQYWLSRGNPERNRLLTVRGGYHGDTFATMAICDPVNGMHDFFRGVLPSHYFAERPSCRFDERFEDRHIADLAAKLEEHRDEIAAVILEPVVQGAGGMWFYAPEYLRRLRALCDANDVLLILDEIATGFGRTGVMFGADHAGVSPDILSLGKSLTGGTLTLAATLVNQKVCDAIAAGEPGALMHGPTYMGNPLACAAALAVLREVLDNDLTQRALELETRIRQEIASWNHPGITEVRGMGLLLGIGLHPANLKIPDDVLPSIHLSRELAAAGLLAPPAGGDTIRLLPPLTVSESEVEKALAIFKTGLDALL